MEGDDHDMPVANAVHVKESQGSGAAAAEEEAAVLAAGELGEVGLVDEDAGEDEDSEKES
jgi:hypothetical protein